MNKTVEIKPQYYTTGGRGPAGRIGRPATFRTFRDVRLHARAEGPSDRIEVYELPDAKGLVVWHRLSEWEGVRNFSTYVEVSDPDYEHLGAMLSHLWFPIGPSSEVEDRWMQLPEPVLSTFIEEVEV